MTGRDAPLAEPGALPADPDRLTILVDHDGWAGLMQVGSHLEADVDGEVYPLIRWDIPLLRAQELKDALDALDDIGDILAATSGEGPNLWPTERGALAEAIEHLVTTGRAIRTPEGYLNLPPSTPPTNHEGASL